MQESRATQGGQTLIFSGHARLPKSIAGREGNTVVCVELEVDPRQHTVVELACRSVLERTEALLRQILVGRRIDQSIEPAVRELQARYYGADLKALCTAIVNAHGAFLRWQHQGD